MNESPDGVTSITSSERGTPPLSDTWGSVIEKQVNVVKKANTESHGVPVWAVAEAEEVRNTVPHVTSANMASSSHQERRPCRLMVTLMVLVLSQ